MGRVLEVAKKYRGRFEPLDAFIKKAEDVTPGGGTKGDALQKAKNAPIGREDGLARTGRIREELDVSGKRSVAFAEIDVEGLPREVVSFSGERGRGGLETAWQKNRSQSEVAQPTIREKSPGYQDAEVKILDNLRAKLRANPKAKGVIRLFVDQPEEKGVCEHCTADIIAFRNEFKGRVELVVSAN